MPGGNAQSGSTRVARSRTRKKKSITEVLESLAHVKRAGAAVTRMEEMCEKLFEMAIRGDAAAMRLILAYVAGRPAERPKEPAREMPPFTADEAAEAERKYREFEARLAASGTGKESAGAV